MINSKRFAGKKTCKQNSKFISLFLLTFSVRVEFLLCVLSCQPSRQSTNTPRFP
jgi:hypothetical protein